MMLGIKKSISLATFALMLMTVTPAAGAVQADGASNHVTDLVTQLRLSQHPEGGSFAEVFTASEKYTKDKTTRALAGSIYFLLDKQEVSHFHMNGCEELWYYHEGCGMRLSIINVDGSVTEEYLGTQVAKGERPMIYIPANTIFAAENLDPDSYTLASCMTTPKFQYKDWRLLSKAELLKIAPQQKDLINRMAFETI